MYIYDDATPRPTSASGHSGAETIDQIHWGANGSTLYGTWRILLTPAGVSTLTGSSSSGVSLASFNGDVWPFHPAIYDRSNGHLYDSFTNAFDPATGEVSSELSDSIQYFVFASLHARQLNESLYLRGMVGRPGTVRAIYLRFEQLRPAGPLLPELEQWGDRADRVRD